MAALAAQSPDLMGTYDLSCCKNIRTGPKTSVSNNLTERLPIYSTIFLFLNSEAKTLTFF